MRAGHWMSRRAVGLLSGVALIAVLAVTLTQLQGDRLATVPASNPHNIGVMEPCGNITYFHCETNRCNSGVFYQNYNPTTDHFSDPYGPALANGEQSNIRDEPYRRYGPRGVRAAHRGFDGVVRYGFYSTTCFP